MPYVDFDLDTYFDLDFVNARVREGTQVPGLELITCFQRKD